MSHEAARVRSRLLRAARRAASPYRPLLRRTSPLSANWGHDRGTPIDRIYIEEFLRGHREDIRGHVLEIRDSRYTERFGTDVTARDVLDLDAGNPAATIVADLAAADAVPDDTFDCFILTQTLQYVSNPPASVCHAHRILRPGGVLLATVPSIIRVDADTPKIDRWRFTEVSGLELFGEPFGSDQVQVSCAGNVLAAIAFLTGMAAEELDPAKLAVQDPDFPVVIFVRAVKAGGPR
jgi:SAM-dependent methyltransferase